MSIIEARNAAVDAVKQLNKDVGIPSTLKEIGVKEEDIPALAQAAFDDVCTGGNPRDTTVKEIEVLYRSIFK
ncbi:iron-containing alcohol dehydrogenase [Orbaceae bacterium ac157xtp]